MAVRKIYEFPAPCLLKKTEQVTEFGSALQTLLEDMFETMYHDKGIGLAANQIGVAQQVLVFDVSPKDTQEPGHIINPAIVESRGECVMDEGCLSFPGVYIPVRRPEWVKIEGVDQNGKPLTLEADGWLSRCLQHEIDHLQGIIFLDHLSTLRRKLALRQLKKAQKT